MDRILIIGIQGAGKSTFANKLGKRLNREVIHLDKFYYPKNWQHTQTKEEWRQTVRDLVAGEKWIIDGNYTSSLDIRLPRATTVIFFNFNKFLCLYRILKRALSRKPAFDKAPNTFNRVSWVLVKQVIKYEEGKVLKIIEEYKDKSVIIVRNDREVEDSLAKLTA